MWVTSEVHGPHEWSGSGTHVCQDPSEGEGEPLQTDENTTGDRATSGVLTSQKVTICVETFNILAFSSLSVM